VSHSGEQFPQRHELFRCGWACLLGVLGVAVGPSHSATALSVLAAACCLLLSLLLLPSEC
jgi:hypothetical protein